MPASAPAPVIAITPGEVDRFYFLHQQSVQPERVHASKSFSYWNSMPASAPAPVIAITPGEVDRFYFLHQQSVQPERVLEDKEFEALKRKIRAAYDEYPAEQSAILAGHKYQLLVEAKGNEKKLPPRARKKVFGLLKKLLKEMDVWALFSIANSTAEDRLGKEVVAPLLVEARTGYRKLTPSVKP
jgi:hypothetical protein